MLKQLVIRNVVLIEALELEFGAGFCALTGETGSGKSILLDALGLALGARAEQRLVRQGEEQAVPQAASVSAEFDISANAACRDKLEELGLPAESPLVLRRTLSADGKSRAFVQDMPVSASALRDIGDTLLEVHGQHEQRGLLEVRVHRRMLDAFGQLQGMAAAVRAAHARMGELRRRLKDEQARIESLQKEEDYLRHVLKELEALNPQANEESELAETRKRMMEVEAAGKGWQDALNALTEPGSPSEVVQTVERALHRGGALSEKAAHLLAEAGEKLALAADELERLLRDSRYDPDALEKAEERLFALRAAARKHHCTVEELAVKRDAFAGQLAMLDHRQEAISALSAELAAAEQAYAAAARALSEARAKAAKKLEKAVAQELAPLKLGNARFSVSLEPLAEGQTSADGLEHVQFVVATNPGSAPGPLAKIASGGELSRLMLALKVALADVDGVPSMVFDEVDTGIGGATAAAVGKRLEMLSRHRQVFVVTHQPQVAALAAQHLHVSKTVKKGTTLTKVAVLSGEARREELARMLAGETITDEARAAADALLQVDV